MKKPMITIGIHLFLFFLTFTATAETSKIKLDFKANQVSARIENAGLGQVLKQFAKEKGILVKCDPEMEPHLVTIQFDHLSTEAGLRRILRNTDHSLIFDKQGRVCQILVKGKGQVKGDSRAASAKPFSPQPANPTLVNNDPAFKIIKNTLPPDGQAKPEPVTDPAFKVIKNTHPPGGPFEPQKNFQP